MKATLERQLLQEQEQHKEFNDRYRTAIEQLLSPENINAEIERLRAGYAEKGFTIDEGKIREDAVLTCENQAMTIFKEWVKNHPEIKGKPVVAVLGGAYLQEDSAGYQSIEKLVELLSQYGITTGSGGSIGAMKAILMSEKYGLPGIGVKIKGVSSEQVHSNTEIDISLDNFAIRQTDLLVMSDVLIVTTGGFGTMFELFEALTRIKTGKYDTEKLVFIVDEGGDNAYWDYIHKQCQEAVSQNLLRFSAQKSLPKILEKFGDNDGVKKLIAGLNPDATLSLDHINAISKLYGCDINELFDLLLGTLYTRVKIGEEDSIVQNMKQKNFISPHYDNHPTVEGNYGRQYVRATGAAIYSINEQTGKQQVVCNIRATGVATLIGGKVDFQGLLNTRVELTKSALIREIFEEVGHYNINSFLSEIKSNMLKLTTYDKLAKYRTEENALIKEIDKLIEKNATQEEILDFLQCPQWSFLINAYLNTTSHVSNYDNNPNGVNYSVDFFGLDINIGLNSVVEDKDKNGKAKGVILNLPVDLITQKNGSITLEDLREFVSEEDLQKITNVLGQNKIQFNNANLDFLK